MKIKNVWLLLFFGLYAQKAPNTLVTDTLKKSYVTKVERNILKDRVKVVLTGAALGGAVVGMHVEILRHYFPDIVKNEKGHAVAFDNPDGKWLLGAGNFLLMQAQNIAFAAFLGFLGNRFGHLFKPGQWNFTLIQFMQKHTQLYGAFEQCNGEVRGLLYQNDEQLREHLVKAFVTKLNFLTEQLCYVDGYVISKIEQYEKASKFNAYTRLSQEYKIFEEVRKSFINEIMEHVQDLQNNLKDTDFQNKVLDCIQALHHGSQNLHQRIQSLNMYE